MLLEEFVEKHKKLLELERVEEVNRSKLLTESSPKTLEEKNLCIRKLSLINIFTGLYGRTILEFESKSKKEESSKSVFSQGDIIGVYIDSTKCDVSKTLSTGLFYKSNKDSIQIALDKNLDNGDEITKEMDCNLFRLVKLSSEITYSRLKSALKYLETRSKPLCGDYLIDVLLGSSSLSPTTPEKQLNFINDSLNHSQKSAVQFALARPDVAIIHGPPGTGKTTVAVEIVHQIFDSCAGGHKTPKILICTPSNIALDNLAEKLLRSYANRVDGKTRKTSKLSKSTILRLGHAARVMPHLNDISLEYRLAGCDQAQLIAEVRAQIDSRIKRSWTKAKDDVRVDRSRWDLADLRRELRDREGKAVREVLNASNVIMSTLTGLRSNKALPLDEIEFDVVLIDEASQAIEAACWLAIPRARKLILAGDHKQLPPTVLSNEATKQGLGLSLMERLLNLYPGDTITRMLSCQYRMHDDIMRWSSQTFYNAELMAHESVLRHLLMDVFPDTDLEGEPLGPLTFIDTAGCDLYELESTQEDSKGNLGEAQLAAVYIQKLVVRFNLQPEHIGVITPYGRQVQLIREAVGNLMGSDRGFDCQRMEISTVDGFQGREKEVIVTTLVRSNPSGIVGFLTEHRRLNVALTRAKRHLCVIGDSRTIDQSGDTILRSLIDFWNSVAEVHSAHEYIYEHDISPGNCVKPTKTPKLEAHKKNLKCQTTENIELEKQVCEQLRSFKCNENEMTLEFPANLNSRIRALLHELAESLQLQHESVGIGKHRKLVVHKKICKKSENNIQDIPVEVQQDTSTDIPIVNEDEHEFMVISEYQQVSLEQDPGCVMNEDYTKIPDIGGSIVANVPCIKEGNKTEMVVRSENNHQNGLSNLVELKSDELVSVIEKQCSKSNTKTFEKAKKKANIPKSTKVQLTNIPDDFDEMLGHFQSMSKRCQNPEKCSTGTSILGFDCQFCKKRFCSAHIQQEVHLCPLATRMAWRHNESAPKPLSNAKKVRHNQLSRMMNHKIQDLSANRKQKKKTDDN